MRSNVADLRRTRAPEGLRRPQLDRRPIQGAHRPYDRSQSRARNYRPPHRSYDHRFARPHHRYVRHHHHAYYSAPSHYYYRPYYTRWYVHPYYRWTYSTTLVVGLGFTTHAYYSWWVPPARPGWIWVPGYYRFGYWHPGFWQPQQIHVVSGYTYVPGHWEQEEVYVEGYYRAEERDGWVWVDGHYLEDGTHVRGHWRPAKDGPEGYQWEPGFFDGETWVDGFWRPTYRSGYTWVSAYFDADGIFHSGYWAPLESQPGAVWVPGWFDGNTWVEGYWVADEEYQSVDLDAWEPDEGWQDGWEVGAGWGDGDVLENNSPGMGIRAEPEASVPDLPLALPVPLDEI